MTPHGGVATSASVFRPRPTDGMDFEATRRSVLCLMNATTLLGTAAMVCMEAAKLELFTEL